jgi:hypothetical protein|tara:strand:+ start:1167 stop:1676 length:510 start_codon:yes stop_codon:yes gene_type:complete
MGRRHKDDHHPAIKASNTFSHEFEYPAWLEDMPWWKSFQHSQKQLLLIRTRTSNDKEALRLAGYNWIRWKAQRQRAKEGLPRSVAFMEAFHEAGRRSLNIPSVDEGLLRNEAISTITDIMRGEIVQSASTRLAGARAILAELKPKPVVRQRVETNGEFPMEITGLPSEA